MSLPGPINGCATNKVEPKARKKKVRAQEGSEDREGKAVMILKELRISLGVGLSGMREVDVGVGLSITFAESVLGCRKKAEFVRRSRCVSCNGTRCANGRPPTRCDSCYGKGFIPSRRGWLMGENECGKCEGEGVVIDNPCPTCNGSGTQKVEDFVMVEVSPLSENGQVISFNFLGHETCTGARGNLHVTLFVVNDRQMRRVHLDIFSHQKVPVWLAVLGGPLRVETLSGAKTVLISPMETHKINLTFEDLGAKCHISGKKGSHIVSLEVQIPTPLGNEEADLFRKLRDLDSL